MENTYDYDVAVTFAGEDRQFVHEVVEQVVAGGYKVFYDQDEQVTLWGEELTEYFPKIYEERARFAVMFVSRHYAAKPWTTFERRSVLVRALSQPTPYLLPVRLDNTKLDGVRSTIQYLDGSEMGPSGVANAILRKLGDTHAEGGGSFNGYVPRTEHEATVLLGERPAGWEYLLFSYTIVRGVEQLHERYLDQRMEFALADDYVPTDMMSELINREFAIVNSLTRSFDTVLSEQAHLNAFGAAGEPADVDQILHMASRYIAIYESLLDWGSRLRGYATPLDEAHELLRSLALFAQQPVERMRSFAYEFRDSVDSVHSRLMHIETDQHVLANDPLVVDLTTQPMNHIGALLLGEVQRQCVQAHAVVELAEQMAARVRGHATSLDEARGLFRVVATHARQPIELMRDFACEFRDFADSLHAKLMAGEEMPLELTLALEVTPEASVLFDNALRDFEHVVSG